ncbi:hypothetical protein IAR50_000395 [Cryptococcus sp. DSM 104548]
MVEKRNNMLECGMPSDDELFCHAIMNSLPSSYRGAVDYIDRVHRDERSNFRGSLVIREVQEEYLCHLRHNPPTSPARTTEPKKKRFFCKYHQSNTSHFTQICRKLKAGGSSTGTATAVAPPGNSEPYLYFQH